MAVNRTPAPLSLAEQEAQAIVQDLLQHARAAQRIAEQFDQERVDELVAAAAWAILEPGRNQALAELAVQDTCLGYVPDQLRKNYRKTLRVPRNVSCSKPVAVIS